MLIISLVAINSVVGFAWSQEMPTCETVESTEDFARRIQSYEATKQQNNNARIGGSAMLNVNIFMQENGSYCGPASAQMVLDYFGISKTQTQLAQEMGTQVPGGTSSSALLSCLANNLGNTVYRTVTTSSTPFNTGLQYSIDNNVPVVCLVQTGVLPIYSENSKDTGHFLVAKGYYWGMQGSSGGNYVRYLDPNNNTTYYGQHDASWDIMELAINNGGGYYTMKY